MLDYTLSELVQARPSLLMLAGQMAAIYTATELLRQRTEHLERLAQAMLRLEVLLMAFFSRIILVPQLPPFRYHM
ncbi:hypothetical protein DLM85_20975 [Hymenobacter edaphi]|uniref:Uncharacterized protein n=1 Tax=Hymenobacter edaphi TaxID=2211146 RepID=A0A328BAJ0_9BACT|nr:hypothetical protein DLM85_20975 [Hymenobacter edaphi]